MYVHANMYDKYMLCIHIYMSMCVCMYNHTHTHTHAHKMNLKFGYTIISHTVIMLIC